MKERTIFVLILLSISSYCHILLSESRALRIALDQTDAGYMEFVKKSIRGKKLYEFIDPNTVGVFRIKEESFACARLKAPLPVLRPKK